MHDSWSDPYSEKADSDIDALDDAPRNEGNRHNESSSDLGEASEHNEAESGCSCSDIDSDGKGFNHLHRF